MAKLKITELRKLCKSQIQNDVLDALKCSSSKERVTKAELMDLFHIDERIIRKVISQMRAQGIPVASDNGKSGYYLPRSFDEYIQFSSAYTSRAYTILDTQRKMKESAWNMFNGQVSMCEKEK